MLPAEESSLENVEIPLGAGDPPIYFGNTYPDRYQEISKFYPLSKPPSVAQHFAITRVRCSHPTRNLRSVKPCVPFFVRCSYPTRNLRSVKPCVPFLQRKHCISWSSWSLRGYKPRLSSIYDRPVT